MLSSCRLFVVSWLIALGSACLSAHGPRRTTLVGPPSIGVGEDLFATLPEPLRTPEMEVLYVTDRRPLSASYPPREARLPGSDGRFPPVSFSDDPARAYGYGRSGDIHFGAATLTPGRDLAWSELTEWTGHPRLPLRVSAATELGLVPNLRELIAMGPDGVHEDTQRRDAARAAVEPLMEAITDRIKESGSGDVYVMVHGFAAGFAESLFLTGQLWHHLGRHGVPVAFSWPAGKGGFIPTAYQHDRESGEYAVLDLKVLLYILRNTPGVERVHLIAHSRGTDVVATTLRELLLEVEDDQTPIRDAFRIQSLVLASPDIDLQIFGRRTTMERVWNLAHRTVLYVSPNDSALRASAWMQGGLQRAGRFSYEMLDEESASGARAIRQQCAQDYFEIVQVRASTRGDTHAYFLSQPAVLSDLIRVLRDQAPAGSPARPLSRSNAIWLLDDGYPNDHTPTDDGDCG